MLILVMISVNSHVSRYKRLSETSKKCTRLSPILHVPDNFLIDSHIGGGFYQNTVLSDAMPSTEHISDLGPKVLVC